MEITISEKKNSNSMKKLFKKFFKSHKAVAADSMESLENSRNASLESSSDYDSMESYENDINESYEKEEEFDYPITTVPVHFVRTEQGTFFWTSAADLVPVHMQDRWAQA
ncbi:enhancer of split m4 protein-like [Musca domestica]|uniref:Enhancer of split m4 protein-like n=1 Tax=Musca domestica TaxID=7370 RepID=A0ABM3UYF4_MUSDO|nr:enhancer of split m4 protein-like [Musca domestica]XP_058988287.1 enhancer of split m4 protein-like [Musca domestica]